MIRVGMMLPKQIQRKATAEKLSKERDTSIGGPARDGTA